MTTPQWVTTNAQIVELGNSLGLLTGKYQWDAAKAQDEATQHHNPPGHELYDCVGNGPPGNH